MSKCNCTPVLPCDCENVSSLRGKSAYEIWVQQQGPSDDTSLEAFLEYMKGGKGDPGDPGDPGDVVTVEGIKPVEGNVRLSRSLQFCAACGTKTITPQIINIQNETIRIFVDYGQTAIVDLANWSGSSDTLPQYNLRLVVTTNTTGFVKIKGRLMWIPEGTSASEYLITAKDNAKHPVVYDIINGAGVPMIVLKYPQIY